MRNTSNSNVDTDNRNDEIIIRPHASRFATAFITENFIHQKELEKVEKWIEKGIDNAEKLHEIDSVSDKMPYQNNAITILGSRGSGKTSFLHTIREKYKQSKDLIVLDLIDPTIIEEKGHIFLTIISQIQKEVEKKWKDKRCYDPEHDSTFWERKEWDDKLMALAKGLPTIDGIGKGLEEWQDPEYIMKKGLEEVRGASELKENFSALMKFGLKTLKKKAFLLTLDDIDVDFLKGWNVLEVIRKYLSTPYIITVLSGDLKLFSKNIRKQQWLRFGKALLKNEAEVQRRMEDYDSLVTEIESQYIQKVLPPSQRISLTTLLEKIQTDKAFIKTLKVSFDGKTEKSNLIVYYKERLEKIFGIHNFYEQQPMLSFFLGLPIRTQIELLLSIEEASESKDEGGVENLSLVDVFLSELHIKEIDIDLAKANPSFLNVVILKFLLKDDIFDNCYQVQPTTSDSILNACLASMSLLFSRIVCDNPYLIFDYIIRIGYTRNLLPIMPYAKGPASIEDMCKRASLFNDHVYRNMLGTMNAYLAEMDFDGDSKLLYNGNSWLGIIPIYSSAKKAKKKIDEENPRMDEVFEEGKVVSWKRQLAYMPLTIAQPSIKQSSSSLYSIYTLLATIGEIIKQQSFLDKNLDQTLQDLSQARSFKVPDIRRNRPLSPYNRKRDYEDSIGGGYPELINLDSLSSVESTTNSVEQSVFAKKISDWIDMYPMNYSLSPHLLGKISTRFFYALKNLEMSESAEKLGEAMSNRVIILYNSILVEECRELMINYDISNDNPREKPNLFFYNLNKLRGNLNKLKLFAWMFRCPLLIPFLNRDYKLDLSLEANDDDWDWVSILLTRIEVDIENEKRDCDTKPIRIEKDLATKEIYRDTIFTELNKIPIKGKKQDEDKDEKNVIEHRIDLTEYLDENGKLRFYYGLKTFQITRQHLIDNEFPFDVLMDKDEKIVVEKLKPYFSSKVSVENLRRFKNRISGNPRK
ncbi:P-loop NTPase fold protein [Porphyromonas levii]|uniref:P-loop NTPase fold protein n=1 Tax=Porphyromonas levii TaxID=28114 RepID=UPI001B8D49F5|nr:P-loop NTPase fold protein [Porphyromonas levii]MBR8758725.1 hypothetical protein [Porphyromonas levii]